MIKLSKEKLKTILLILLVITSMIQLGIHWGQQVQGFPFPFIAQIFSEDDSLTSTDLDTLKYRYFVPESIIVSVSDTSPRWKLDESDAYFNRIWNDVKENYLPAMIKQKPTKIVSKEQWSEITNVRSCIQIDFTDNLLSEIIHPYENGDSADSSSFDSIEKIAVLPQTDVNETINTVYAYDGNQIYQFQINIKEGFLAKSFYKKIADELQDKPGLSLLSTTGYDSPEDILISRNKGRGSLYPTLKLEIPEQVILKMENIENENIQNSILLNQKDSLMGEYDQTKGSEALFTDRENLYRLFDNGILEYKYLPVINTQAGDVADAFAQAITFLEPRQNLLGNMEVILTDIIPEENYYIMNFGYKYKGQKIYYTGNRFFEKIESPLVIKANSERVLECKWVIRSVSEFEKPKRYSVYFGDLFNDKLPTLYPEVIERQHLYFTRIEPGYVFRSIDQGGLPIAPNWIVSTGSKDYFIPLTKEED